MHNDPYATRPLRRGRRRASALFCPPLITWAPYPPCAPPSHESRVPPNRREREQGPAVCTSGTWPSPSQALLCAKDEQYFVRAFAAYLAACLRVLCLCVLSLTHTSYLLPSRLPTCLHYACVSSRLPSACFCHPWLLYHGQHNDDHDTSVISSASHNTPLTVIAHPWWSFLILDDHYASKHASKQALGFAALLGVASLCFNKTRCQATSTLRRGAHNLTYGEAGGSRRQVTFPQCP
eukprot:673263-Pelagomonas_calceolata.AAC.4